MSEPFLAEIRIMGFDFPPRGWARCDGQILPINQNQALFSLMGTTYGGDGRVNFALPDLRGRVPIGFTSDGRHPLGERVGEENHVLSAAEMPSHSHAVRAVTADATAMSPAGRLLAHAQEETYGPAESLAPLAAEVVGTAGGSQPHTNIQPSYTLTFCIALQGIFPFRI
jgi:microcystin-dependent protein